MKTFLKSCRPANNAFFIMTCGVGAAVSVSNSPATGFTLGVALLAAAFVMRRG